MRRGGCVRSPRTAARSPARATTHSGPGGGSPDRAGTAGEQLRQQLGDANVPVHIEGSGRRPDRVTLTEGPLTIGHPEVPTARLAGALGLDASAFDPTLPPVTGSTASVHLLLAITDRATLDTARPDPVRLRAVLAAAGAQGCYLYSLDPIDPAHHAHGRPSVLGIDVTEIKLGGRCAVSATGTLHLNSSVQQEEFAS